jgi:hypothetical protein
MPSAARPPLARGRGTRERVNPLLTLTPATINRVTESGLGLDRKGKSR